MEIHLFHHLSGRVTLVIDRKAPTLGMVIGPFSDRKAPIVAKSITLKDNQHFTIKFPGAQDAEGNPVPYAAPLTVVASDPTALIVTPDPTDPTSFDVAAFAGPGKLGAYTLTSSDTVITEVDTVTVVTGDEASLGAVFSDPTDIVPTTTAAAPGSTAAATP